MKKRKKIKLNLNIEFLRIGLFTIFTRRKNYDITCAIPCSEKPDKIYPITSINLFRLKNSAYKDGAHIVPISSRLPFYTFLALI